MVGRPKSHQLRAPASLDQLVCTALQQNALVHVAVAYHDVLPSNSGWKIRNYKLLARKTSERARQRATSKTRDTARHETTNEFRGLSTGPPSIFPSGSARHPPLASFCHAPEHFLLLSFCSVCVRCCFHSSSALFFPLLD